MDPLEGGHKMAMASSLFSLRSRWVGPLGPPLSLPAAASVSHSAAAVSLGYNCVTHGVSGSEIGWVNVDQSKSSCLLERFT